MAAHSSILAHGQRSLMGFGPYGCKESDRSNLAAVVAKLSRRNSGRGHSVQFSSVAQSCPTLCHPMNRSRQPSLSITNFRSPPKPMSIESMMSSSHLILCYPLLLLPSIFPSIKVFSDESALHIRWPKYWSFSLKIIIIC